MNTNNMNPNNSNIVAPGLINTWALNQHLRPQDLPLLPDEFLFNEQNFLDQFNIELAQSLRIVIIQSPYVSLAAVKRLQPTLKILIERGVQVCMFLRDPSSTDWNNRTDPSTDHSAQAIEILKALGVHICFRQRIHQKIVIIDGRISYFGSLNVLSFNPKHSMEAMVRSSNPVKAQWLMLFFALNACPQCITARESVPSPSLSINFESLGRIAAATRTNNGLSQDEVARQLGIQRNSLCQLESGKFQPSFSTLLELGKVLDRELVWIPSGLVPFVEQYVKAFTDRASKAI